MPDESWQPQIVAFVCQWCTYAGADLAGTSRMKYAPNVRIVKLPCSGRIDPLFLVKAFEQGADGVLVSGCHPGNCHYVSGNLLARRRFTVFRELLSFLGLERERLQFSWVSAAEAVKWTEVVDAVTAQIRAFGPRGSAWGEALETNGFKFQVSGSQVEPGTPNLEPGTQKAAEESIRRIARQLLEANAVDVVVGYGNGTLSGVTTPVFVTQPDGVEQLVWNERCLNNLSVYLTRDLVKRLGRVGIVAKGCDARALVALLQETQINRDQLTIIGVPCEGMMEDGRLAVRCVTCDVHTPPIYDHLVKVGIGNEISEIGESGGANPRDAEIAVLEALMHQERWAYWQEQFSRCIRCYACRAVCPLCYCDTCIVEQTQPQWIPPAFDAKGNLSWNIVRALHLAGRCIGCDECTRACPANIRLDLINRKLALLIGDEYGYRAGYDAGVAPPLTTFRPEDRAEFIR